MRQSHRLSHAFALIGAIALSASFLQMLPPGAAEAAVVQGQLPAPAFDNDTPEVLVSITSGSTTTMYTVDDTTMNLTAIPGSGSTISYDATGYRSADQYVYGIASGGRLVRIGSTGNVEVVGTIAALGSTMYNAGTFGTGAASDILYLRSASAGQIVAINFAGCTTGSGGAWDTGGTNATSCLTTTTYNFGTTSATNDLVYKNGELFSITASGQLLIIDLNSATGTNNTVTTSLVSVPGLPSASGYGAQWLYGNGNLAALNSDNNTIYQIDISDPTKPTIINSAPAPNNQGSSGRDGTNVPGHPVDLSLSKEVSVTDSGDAPAATTTFTPGQSLTYTFVVTNNSAYQSSGWSVADFLNNILSSDITQGDIGYPTWNGQGTPPAVYCSFASTAATTLTCNGAGLAPNTSSQPFEITVQTSKNTTTALANTAVVTGKEADPSDCSDSSSDDCNNDSTATANPALLQLTKTASPTDDLELGQNITYTFTLTNAGTQPLTNIQINDLGVVDVKATDDDGNPTDTSPAGGTFNGYTCANGQTNGSITLATQNSSTTCTATYGPITQADVDAGWVENTAQASYKVNGTGPTLDTDVKTADTKYQAPGQITLSKAITGTTMTPAKAASISDTITYQLVAKNTGTVTLNNVSIIDPLLGGSTQQEQLNKIGTSCKYSAVGSNTGHAIGDTAATNGEIVLGPGDEVTCSGLQYTLTQSDIDKGVVYNSATVTGNPVNDAPQVTAGSNADASAPTEPVPLPEEITPNPGISLDKTATETKPGTEDPADGFTETKPDSQPGERVYNLTNPGMVTYKLIVQNTGNVTLTNVNVVDPPTSDGFNGTDPSNLGTVSNCQYSDASGTPLADATPLTNGQFKLDPDAPDNYATCTVTYPVDQTQIDTSVKNGTAIINTASVTGKPPTGDDVDGNATATINVTANPKLTLDKTVASVVPADSSEVTQGCTPGVDPDDATQGTACEADDVITYALTVTNDSNVTMSNVNVYDNSLNLPNATTNAITVKSCTYTKLGPDSPNSTEPSANNAVNGSFSMAPGDVVTCTASYQVTQEDVDAGGSITNTAHVAGVQPGGDTSNPDVSESNSASVAVTQVGSLGLEKFVDTGTDDGATPPTATVSSATQQVKYSFLITNTGNVTVRNVSLTDSMLSSDGGLANVQCQYVTGSSASDDTGSDVEMISQDDNLDNGQFALAPGQQARCSASAVTFDQSVINKGGTVTNSAEVTGTNPECSDGIEPGTAQAVVDIVAKGGITLDKQISSGSSTLSLEPDATNDVGNRFYRLTSSTNSLEGPLTYTFIVENSGQTTLNGFTLTDSMMDDYVGDPNNNCSLVTSINADGTLNLDTESQASGSMVLQPGQEAACTATYELGQTTIDTVSASHSGSQITNNATVTSGTLESSAKAVVQWSTSYSASLYKTSDVTAVTEAGQTINYTLSSQNTGNISLTGLSINEGMKGVTAGNCLVYDAATVTTNPSATDGTAPVNDETVAPSGTGTPMDNGSITLAPGQWVQCTAQYVVQQSDINNNGDAAHQGSGTVDNVATVTADQQPDPDEPLATKDHPIPIDQNPSIKLVKSVDTDAGATPSDVYDATTNTMLKAGTLTYEFTATNDGNVDLTGVKITDDSFNDVTIGDCSYSDPTSTTTPDNVNGFDLAVGQSVTCTGTHTVSQDDYDAAAIAKTTINNQATATGTGPKNGVPTTVTDDDTVETPVTATPSIKASKVVTSVTPNTSTDPAGCTPGVTNGQGTVCGAGDVVNYTFTAYNNGTTTLNGVKITDNPSPANAADAQVAPSVGNCFYVSATNPNDTSNTADASGFVLTPGQTVQCTAQYTVTQADITAGTPIVDTATAADNNGTTDTTGNVTVTVSQKPGITIVKSLDPNSITQITKAGQKVTYDFLVTNSGNLPLTGVTVTDVPALDATGYSCSYVKDGSTASTSGFALDPGQQVKCTGTYTVQQGDIDKPNGTTALSDTATVNGKDSNGNRVSDNDTMTVPVVQNPSLTVTKSANPTSVTGAGQTINYSALVKNTGNVTLTNVTVADTDFTGTGTAPTLSCGTGTITLAPGATITCTGTYVTQQSDIDQLTEIDNTATASAFDTNGNLVSSLPSEATVGIAVAPLLTVTKTADPATVSTANTPVQFTIKVTNSGPVTVKNVTVTDNALPNLTPLSCTVADATGKATDSSTTNGQISLNPGDVATCTTSYTVTQTDLDTKTTIANTATASGTTDKHGNPPDASNNTTVNLNPGAPKVKLAKSVSPATVSKNGDQVTYTFQISNPGNVTLQNISLADVMPSGLPAIDMTACNTALAALNAAGGLAPNATPFSCTATYTVNQAGIDLGSFTNTAKVTAYGPDLTTSTTDTSTATVTATPAPKLTVVKSATVTTSQVDPADNTVYAKGDTINYTFEVTNDGNVTMKGVTVQDSDLGGAIKLNGCTDTNPLTPGQMFTCTGTYTVTQTDINNNAVLANVAQATGSEPSGKVDGPYKSNEVDVTPKGTYLIGLTKTPDLSEVTKAGQTITYTFTATNTGTATLDKVAITDTLSGVTMASNCANLGTLIPGATASCTGTYTITQPDIDNAAAQIKAGTTSPQFTNTAKVTAQGPQGQPASNTATANVPEKVESQIQIVKSKSAALVSTAPTTLTYTFTVTNTGDTTLSNITVSDPMLGGPQNQCATETLAPGQDTVCTNTYTVTQSMLDAAVANPTANGKIINWATATASGPDKDVSSLGSATVNLSPAPSMTLTKTADTKTVTAAGQKITYTLTVTNNGGVTLSNVAVNDPMFPNLVCSTPSLAPQGQLVCPATYTVTQTDIDTKTDIPNTATATAKAPDDSTITKSANADVAVQGSSSISLTKVASVASVAWAGDPVTYTLTAKNTGTKTLEHVTITDPLAGLGTITCPDPGNGNIELAPGASVVCTAAYAVSQPQIDAATQYEAANNGTHQTIPNTATVTADGNVTNQASASVTILPKTSIWLGKTASLGTAVAGDTVTYTFTLQNIGSATLYNVNVTDTMPGLSGITCANGVANGQITLAPWAKTTCTATYVVQQSDVDADKPIPNTATATGTNAGGQKTSAPSSASVNVNATDAITLTKSADTHLVTKAGTPITYTLTATNTGTTTLHNVVVSDPMTPSLSCDLGVLAPTKSGSCQAVYTVTQADLDNAAAQSGGTAQLVNNAVVNADNPQGQNIHNGASETVTLAPTSGISLTKTASTTPVTKQGDTVTYTFTVTNTGTTTLKNVFVTDPLLGGAVSGCTWASLGAGATQTCDATYAATQADIDAGTIHNAATATGTTPGGTPVTGPGTVDVTTHGTYSITLTKQPDLTQVTKAGQIITYTLTATNNGTATLHNVVITDTDLPGLVLDTACGNLGTLAPTASAMCRARYMVTQTDIDNAAATLGVNPLSNPQIANTAGVSAIGPQGTNDQLATDTATANVPVKPTSSISIDKSASVPSVSKAGDQITYTFVVTNTGTTTLKDVSVSDPMPGLSFAKSTCGNLGTLNPVAPGNTATCTATYTVQQSDIDAASAASAVSPAPYVLKNTATAHATAPGGPVCSSDTATVKVLPTSGITLTKSVTPTTMSAPGQATYTFTVKNVGTTTLTNVTITDPMTAKGLSLDGACTNMGTNGALAPGQTATCTGTYQVSQGDIDANAPIVNKATVTGTNPAKQTVCDTGTATITPNGTSTVSLTKVASVGSVSSNADSVTYTFTATNTGTRTLTHVSITDPLMGLSAISCTGQTNGQITLAPKASITCTATYVPDQQQIDDATQYEANNDGAHALIVNKATVTADNGADDTATATVTILPKSSITLTKVPSAASAVKGDTITYTFTVQNMGTTTLHDVTIDDTMPGLSDITCTGGAENGSITLAPQAKQVCTATYVVTQGDIDADQPIPNSATATGTEQGGQKVSAPAQTSVNVNPVNAITLTKSATPSTVTTAGQKITYTLTATNTGTTTLHAVVVTDPMFPGLSCTVDTLAPDASKTCQVTYEVTQADIDAAAATASGTGTIVNNATVVAQNPQNVPVGNGGGTSVTVAPKSSLSLSKTASTTPVVKADDPVTYTFTVTNTGDTTLTDVAVDDPLLGGAVSGCSWASLAPGAVQTCQATYAATQADIDAGTIHNAATATGTNPGGVKVSGDDSVDVTTQGTSSLALVKTADPQTVDAAGQQITYTFVVTNTGSRTVSHVQVLDTSLPGMDFTGSTCSDLGQIGPNQSQTCTATYTVTQANVDAGGTLANTATAQGIDSAGQQTVSQPSTATVTVTQSPSLTLDKTVSQTTDVAQGTKLVYGFLVTNTGNVDLTNVTVEEGAFTGTGPKPQVDPGTCTVVTGSVTVTDGVLALAPGAAVQCFSTPYTVTEQDVLTYQSTLDPTTGLGGTLLSNTATVNATAPNGEVSATDTATSSLTAPAPSVPAGPVPTTPATTVTAPKTSKPYAPTGGTVVAPERGFTAIPITAGFFGLLGLLWFGLSRNRRQERAD